MHVYWEISPIVFWGTYSQVSVSRIIDLDGQPHVPIPPGGGSIFFSVALSSWLETAISNTQGFFAFFIFSCIAVIFFLFEITVLHQKWHCYIVKWDLVLFQHHGKCRKPFHFKISPEFVLALFALYDSGMWPNPTGCVFVSLLIGSKGNNHLKRKWKQHGSQLEMDVNRINGYERPHIEQTFVLYSLFIQPFGKFPVRKCQFDHAKYYKYTFQECITWKVYRFSDTIGTVAPICSSQMMFQSGIVIIQSYKLES